MLTARQSLIVSRESTKVPLPAFRSAEIISESKTPRATWVLTRIEAKLRILELRQRMETIAILDSS